MNPAGRGVLVVANPMSEPILPVCIEVDEEAYLLNSKEAPKRTFPACVSGIEKHGPTNRILNFNKLILALADTGAQVVAAGPGFADTLGVNKNELIPVDMATVRGVTGQARILGAMFVKISAKDANGNTLNAK